MSRMRNLTETYLDYLEMRDCLSWFPTNMATEAS